MFKYSKEIKANEREFQRSGSALRVTTKSVTIPCCFKSVPLGSQKGKQNFKMIFIGWHIIIML